MHDTLGLGVRIGWTAENPAYLGFESREDVSLLVHFGEVFLRKLTIPKIGNEMAAWIRQETGALVVQDTEERGEQEVVAAINACVAKGKRCTKGLWMEKTPHPQRHRP